MSPLKELQALFDTEDTRAIVETIYHEIPHPIGTNIQALITHLKNLTEPEKRKEFITRLAQLLEFVLEENKPSILKDLIKQPTQINDYYNILFGLVKRPNKPLTLKEAEPALMALTSFFNKHPDSFLFLSEHLIVIPNFLITSFINQISILITTYTRSKGIAFITYPPINPELHAFCPNVKPINCLTTPNFEKKLNKLSSYLLQIAMTHVPELIDEELQKAVKKGFDGKITLFLFRLATTVCHTENYKILYLSPMLVKSSLQLFREFSQNLGTLDTFIDIINCHNSDISNPLIHINLNLFKLLMVCLIPHFTDKLKLLNTFFGGISSTPYDADILNLILALKLLETSIAPEERAFINLMQAYINLYWVLKADIDLMQANIYLYWVFKTDLALNYLRKIPATAGDLYKAALVLYRVGLATKGIILELDSNNPRMNSLIQSESHEALRQFLRKLDPQAQHFMMEGAVRTRLV